MKIEQTEQQESYLPAVAMILLLTVSFFAIEHSWDASVYVMFAGDYTGDENRTGDALGIIHGLSSVFRILLAGIGVIALAFPNRYKINLGSPLLWVWFCYWAWLFTSVLWSENQPNTIFKLSVLSVFGMAAWGLTRWFSITRWNLILVGTCCSFMVIGLLAELENGTFRPWMDEYRFSGTKHPNSFAIYGATMVLAAATHFGRKASRSFFWILFGCIGVLCILMTKSRTTLLGLVVGLSAIQFLRLPAAKRITYTFGFAGIASVMGLGLSLISTAAMKGRLGSIASMGRGQDVATLTGRLPLWEELMDHIQDRPIFGYGYLGFWDAERVEELADIFAWEIPHGHNMYLDVILDVGMIGLVLYIGFLLTVLLASWNVYVRGQPGAAFVFGLTCTVIVHGGAESLFKLPTFAAFMLYSSVFRLLWTEADGPSKVQASEGTAAEPDVDSDTDSDASSDTDSDNSSDNSSDAESTPSTSGQAGSPTNPTTTAEK